MRENVSTQSLLERDRALVFHASTHLRDYAQGRVPGRVISGGRGIRLRDRDGHELIDGFAGLYCVNVGYGREEIIEAIAAQGRKLAYYHTYAGHTNEPLVELSEKVLGIAGQGMSKIYYGLSGSDANETQIKLVRYHANVLGTDKKKIISRTRGYHGSTIAAGSLTGLPSFHDHFDLPIAGVFHTDAPYYYRRDRTEQSEREFSRQCAESLEALILREGPDTVGAFIAEPVLGTGGIVPPPQGYWKEIRAVLDRYQVLLIADEVVCGFGRLGVDFGSQYYTMKPDLITVAKGLTSAYLPLSGVMVGERVWRVLEQGTGEFGPIGHGYTYSGHPLGAAAALANLEIIRREGLTANAARVGAHLQARLAERFEGHPLVGDVRGAGLLAALEFSPRPRERRQFEPALKIGAQVSAAALEQGLIARAMPHGDILGFAPPLVITTEEVDDLVERAGRAVDRVRDELIREGVGLD
ncbi:aminotransferase [Halotalea alkalilenta]|uniref:aminotransferase n=1 Tax=Halotalea alkalilenta TaxID=376489 RepID=UPI000481399F|nr:aminotransferase [Halotalea alkalilenta]